MSNDFKKVLVKDDRLMVSNSIDYAVFKGGQNVVPSLQPAVSDSNSAITFNIQVPSEQTLVDRRVMWSARAKIQFNANNKPVLGQDAALAAFPLHQLCTTIQCTINNNSTSVNIRDVLPALLKCVDSREMARYSSTTPVQSDVLRFYYDSTSLASNNILGGYEQGALDPCQYANGAFAGYGANNLSNFAQNGVVLTEVTAPTEGAPGLYTLEWTTSEPLMCPPFVWAEPETNNSAIYGIQNMNIVLNLGNPLRAVRTSYSGVDGWTNVQLLNVGQNYLNLNYITSHPSDLMPARNVVPYLEYPRYFSASSQVVANASSTTISSNTFNLNQIPDKLIIFLRKPQTLQTNSDSDRSFPIQKISINFNNNAGILSSASQYDLFRYSVEAGSKQSYAEFAGLVNWNTGGGETNAFVQTVGSYLMLDFGKHIQLTEDYYAPGSLGNFQIQFDLTVTGNYTAVPSVDAPFAPEVVLIPVNSGIFVTERGQSSVYTGILTKQDVLDASQTTALAQSSVRRVVGGSMCDRGKALAVHKMKTLHSSSAPSASSGSGMSGAAMKSPLSHRLM